MNKPKVRQIEPQKIESEKEVDGYEAQELLKKYGYTEEYSIHKNSNNKLNKYNNSLTFEEMIKKEKEKKEKIERDRIKKENAPKPITFDGSKGYNSKVKYGSDDGISFKIEVSSDMKL